MIGMANTDQSVRARKLPPLCPPFRFSTVDVSSHVQVLLYNTPDTAREDKSSPSEGNTNRDEVDDVVQCIGAVKVERRRKSDGDDGVEHDSYAGDGTRTQHSESIGNVPVVVMDSSRAQVRMASNREEDINHSNNNNKTSDSSSNSDAEEDYDDDEGEEEDEEPTADNTITYDSYLKTHTRITRPADPNNIDTNNNNTHAASSRSAPLSVHRGAYPTLHNFRFLRRLNLKSLVSLLPNADPPRRPTKDLIDFCAGEGITHHCFPSIRNSDVVLVSSAVAAKVVELLLEPANLPCYVHCTDGRHATGLVMMVLRAVQQWSPTSIISEYSRFVKDSKLTEEESMFVAVFSSPICLPPVVPAWLWRGALPAKIHDKVNGGGAAGAAASPVAGLDLIFPIDTSGN